jgi:hypothetical protein
VALVEAQRCRVAEEGGAIHEVTVTLSPGPKGGYVGSYGDEEEGGDAMVATPREAVMEVASGQRWRMRQILAPGEPSAD